MRVCRYTYRGIDGWILRGPRVSIFFEHESAARRTKAKLAADPSYWTTTEDYLP